MTELTNKIAPPLKWHGGKTYLAKWIRSFDPVGTYCHRVHPYGGGLGEFWNWPHEGVSEVVNDIDLRLTNLWRVLQYDDCFAAFVRIVEATPFSSVEWNETFAYEREICLPDTYAATKFFTLIRQSRQGLATCFATLSRNRVRRGMNEQASSWLSAVEGLRDVHERLRRVVVDNVPALDLIRREDGARTFFYLDPPYTHDSRSATAAYEFEMTTEDHATLLALLAEISGKFLLSGYHSPLYDEAAVRYGWRCHEKRIDNKSSNAKVKEVKTECLWCNF